MWSYKGPNRWLSEGVKSGLKEGWRSTSGQTFPFPLLSSVQCEGVRYRIEEWCVISSGPCHKLHVAVSGASERSKLHWQFFLWKRINQYTYLSASQNTVPKIFPEKFMVLVLIFLEMQSDTSPCSFVSLRGQAGGISFYRQSQCSVGSNHLRVEETETMPAILLSSVIVGEPNNS
jgi:hypothetical protein